MDEKVINRGVKEVRSIYANNIYLTQVREEGVEVYLLREEKNLTKVLNYVLNDYYPINNSFFINTDRLKKMSNKVNINPHSIYTYLNRLVKLRFLNKVSSGEYSINVELIESINGK